ncbi:dihydrolipoamide acetyltransferase family protein [Homoserinimonas sp. A447]
MTTSEFLLPDAGEGLTEAEIVSWKVAVGDTVAVNQVIVEIETAKSLVELPSPFDGVVEAILVEEGVTVAVGTPIIAVATGASPAGRGAPERSEDAQDEGADTVADAAASVSSEDQPGAVLVGYGLKGSVSSRRTGRRAVPEVRPAVPPASGTVLAKPPVRKLAKDLEVDLASVTATGPIGEVTRDDVLRQASQVSVFRNLQTPEWASEREERIPVKGVRKAIASAMVSSAFSAPHVGVFVDVDATRTMEFVKRLKASTDFAGVKVSPLLIIAKAISWAVRRNPTVNAQWTDDEIIVKHFVNLGIAAATPRGLIVPNIKDAHDLSLLELAQAIEQLTTTARDGKTQPAEMANGTITITNIGVFGMDTGTPILNPGEVAIVALGTIKQKPWVVDGEVRARFVTTLGASFDHRVVDGDVASRFLADVASIVEEPALLLD